MLAYFFISLAAIFNAIMDTLWTKYGISVFKNLNPNWWNPNESWKYYKNFLGIVRLDAWHIAKYGMLGCITLAVINYNCFFVWDMLLLPIVWSISFELFYSLILKSK